MVINLLFEKAAQDSVRLMGKMHYLQTIYEEEEYEQFHDMTNILDVSNKLELVKHTVSLDKTPAELGGKNNEWRPLRINRMSTTYIGGIVN